MFNNQKVQRWFKRFSKWSSCKKYEYKAWWFAKLGQPKVDVPIKYYLYDPCTNYPRYVYKIEDNWEVYWLMDEADPEEFTPPPGCVRPHELNPDRPDRYVYG